MRRRTGTLVTATVQPIGYLDLTTSSTETFEVQGCPGNETACGAGCVDTLDVEHQLRRLRDLVRHELPPERELLAAPPRHAASG